MSAIPDKLSELAAPAAAGGSRLRGWLPGTMAGLVAMGYVLVTTPLLATVALTGMSLDRLTGHAQQLVDEGLTLVRLGAQLRDNLTDLERNARQYAALREPELLPVINKRLDETELTLAQIESHDLHAAVSTELAQARQGLTDALREWNLAVQSGGALGGAVDRIHSLTPQADRVVASGRAAIDAEVAQLRDASAAVRRLVLFSVLALIPLTALLAYGFSRAVTRPLRELARGIAALGHTQYQQPIAIAFPQEMRRLGEQLDWLRRRLAQLEADKDSFLRHVSHELKTPLASLSEGTGLLHEEVLGPLAPAQREVAQILAEATGELNAQIHNLLTYAEWRQERLRAPPEWFDAALLVRDVLNTVKLPMARRELRPELRLRAVRLFGQRARLRTALENLVTNAIKHAPRGSGIEIAAEGDGEHFLLAVRDYGRGVAEGDRRRIFEPFVRGQEAEEAGFRGTGIGLTIVQEAMAAHEGTVEVEDARPGARFVLRWPCRVAAAA